MGGDKKNFPVTLFFLLIPSACGNPTLYIRIAEA